MSTPARRARILASLVALLVLSACAGTPAVPNPAPDGAETSGSSTRPSTEDPRTRPLECEQEGYPCSMADVGGAVVQQTMELGDQAAERMARGESAEDVAAWLMSSSGAAEVSVDGTTIRYRLEGGRPAWIGHDPEPDANATRAQPDAVLAMYHEVAGSGDPEKRAMVLSPFKWELAEGDYGSRVAEMLRGVPGYASGVTYQENATETATGVTVETFASLGGNAVVYIQTNSLKLCEDGTQATPGTPTPLASPCWGVIGAQEFYGTDFREADYVGVELFRYVTGSWSLGLTADFFAAHYANGIDDAIIILNAPDVLDSSLLLSMQGPSSDFLGWDNLRPLEQGGDVILALLARLSSVGRTVDSVYDEMRPTLRAGSAELFHVLPEAGGSNRLRDVIHLRDQSSGEPLDEVGVLTASTKLGDEEEDVVSYVVDIEGLTAEEAAVATVNLFYGNYQMDPLLAGNGEQIGDTTWRLEGQAQVGALTEGQSLDVRAYVQLPEGGTSRDAATVTIAGLRQDIGTRWAGTITSTLGSWFPGVTTTRTAEVEFTRDPSAGADADQVYFYVSGGSLTWTMSGTSEGCSYDGFASGVPLNADEYTYLRFDVSGESITYSANADNDDGPTVDVAVDCATHDYTYGTGAEGLWWYLPPQAGFQLTGDTLAGTWSDGTTHPTTWTWKLHRVDD